MSTNNDIKKAFKKESTEILKAFIDVLENMEKSGKPPLLASIISAATYLISNVVIQDIGLDGIDDDILSSCLDSIKTALDSTIVQMKKDTAELFDNIRAMK